MPNRTQSIDSRAPPRRAESNVSQTQPAIKVVGFRVEGAASPSPPSTLLGDSQRNEHNASPNPVIIPPSFQTESPNAPGSRKTSGDQATTLPRQKTAPVFVPGSLPGDGHVQDPSILVSGAHGHGNPRGSTSPPKPLTIHTSVSLPPVGSASPIRWELEQAAEEFHESAQQQQPAPCGLGHLSVPVSPHQRDTPTFGRSHVPASPFASVAHSEELPAGAPFERKSDPDRHSDSKSSATKSIQSSPRGTPKATQRQASFSHHNVPPIASTVAAAIGSLVGGATSAFQPGTSYAGGVAAGPPDLRRRSLEQAPKARRRSLEEAQILNRHPTEIAASSSLFTSTGAQGSPKKPDLEIPPPPAQPVHQSASAAELAAQAREAEQAEQDQLQQQQGQLKTSPAPTPTATPKQIPTGQGEPADKGQTKDAASKTKAEPAVKTSSKESTAKLASKDVGPSGKGGGREGGGVAAKEHKAPSKAPSRIQQDARQEKPKKDPPQAALDAQDKEKPKTTKAERRAKQEAERAAKEAGVVKGGSGAKQGNDRQAQAQQAQSQAQSSSQAQPGPSKAKAAKQASKAPQQSKATPDKHNTEAVSLPSDMFAHLPQYKRVTLDSVMARSDLASTVHPAVLQLGLRYAEGSIKGANARCIAMLDMLRNMVQDYETPAGKVLSRDLTQQLNTTIQFLVHCRPLSISMGNAIKNLKLQISKIDPSARESDAKEELVGKIDTYIQEKIVFADNVLVTNAVAKVYDEDVILTYAFSSVVFNVLLRAHKEGKRFRVVVMDSRPQLEGRALLQRLLGHGIACSYVLLNAASYIMQEVTKVFLGASAVLSNGTVMSRAGSAAVAMMANASSKPVLICCETYKFHEKVQLDSITANELGDPDALIKVANQPEITALQNWEQQPRLGLLNLTYDAMPSEYVTLVVTEFGAVPPTSVPVILREYRQEPTI